MNLSLLINETYEKLMIASAVGAVYCSMGEMDIRYSIGCLAVTGLSGFAKWYQEDKNHIQ
ncbi:MAG: hypothetical protein PHF67_03940 [Candidatus Nanoarchaeia archaeon]|nr:hypothetical protein [Candidatus Nanoarchaeia archaeon]